MSVVGFTFTKIHLEKRGSASGKIDIKNNVSIVDVQDTELSLGTSKQKGVKFIFDFVSNYEPKIGQMLFSGEILYLDAAKKNEEIVKGWKKDKKVSKELMKEILNTVLMRCNVEAMVLSRDINLPPPIPLNIPKVQ